MKNLFAQIKGLLLEKPTMSNAEIAQYLETQNPQLSPTYLHNVACKYRNRTKRENLQTELFPIAKHD